MKMLLIEDEDASRQDTLDVIHSLDSKANVLVAEDRDAAMALLETDDFDLVICDLRIPAGADDSDASVAHGLAVHAASQRLSPGTPLIFLTAYATDRNVRAQLSSGGVADYYGQTSEPLVQLAIKDGTGEEVPLIRKMVQGLERLEALSVVTYGGTPSDLLLRAVRMYGFAIEAESATLILLSGLSGAEVGRATYTISTEQSRQIVVKVEEAAAARTEVSRYHVNVPNILPNGYFAPLVSPAFHGLRKQAALHYTLLRGTRSFFQLVRNDPQSAAVVVAAIAKNHAAWTDEGVIRATNVGNLRRLGLRDGDPRATMLWEEPWWQAVEGRSVELSFSTIHGDFHGENILVDPGGRPTIIDYADVQFGPSVFDPVTLELSLLFHEHGPGAGAEWVSPERIAVWSDLEAFVRDLRLAPVIRACRAWAYQLSSEEGFYSAAYCLAAKRLKYGASNLLALLIARQAAEHLRNE